MIKRFVSTFLVFLCLYSLLAGCSNQQEPPTTTQETTPMNIMQKTDPAQDDTVNILMIGNSHCYYYADELVGLAAAAGIKLRVSNVYHSGCIIRQHYQWWKEGQSNYTFITHDESGRSEVTNASLDYCLQQANWDAISLQTGTADFVAKPPDQVISETRDMRKELWEHIKTQFPMSKHYWHHSWSFQVGAKRYGTPEKQHELDQKLATIANQVCLEDDLLRIPTGVAWRLVRDGGYDNLCARIGVTGDYGHDGDVGGGQYLNACVWFEVITGQSCIGNPYRPAYALDETLIPTLQDAAHKAVQQSNN